MAELELVKMSPKGQLVVPKEIREKGGFRPGQRFVPFAVKGGVLFKKMDLPSVKAEFASLAKEMHKQFKSKNVSPKDVDEAVKWTRKG